MSKIPTIGVVLGTRPEAIKLAPVVFELQKRSDEIRTLVISTSQHRQMLDQVLQVFNFSPDLDLDLMQPNQTLSGITCRVLQATDGVLQQIPLDCLMVQGDTTTAFAASLAAFYRRVPVAHVEAGLRSRDIYNPYPEEVNRRLTSVVTEINLAPTPLAAENLIGEGVDPGRIVVTGNTVVDAARMLMEMNALDRSLPPGVPEDDSRIILITSHRRESWGSELENICDAIACLVRDFPDVRVVYPVHMNPNVRTTVLARLGKLPRVHLTEPLDYFGFLALLRRCYLVLTDSGGVQEEAPSFGKPVLVLRKVTERPEASMMGLSRIVGTSREAIVEEASELLTNPAAYRAMAEGSNPYGDGRAAERIVESLVRWFHGERPILEDRFQFRGPQLTMEEVPAVTCVVRSLVSTEGVLESKQ
jgi:UDP-N-acetylglucosamine 2-epimerase (non-hydrolysing)